MNKNCNNCIYYIWGCHDPQSTEETKLTHCCRDWENRYD